MTPDLQESLQLVPVPHSTAEPLHARGNEGWLHLTLVPNLDIHVLYTTATMDMLHRSLPFGFAEPKSISFAHTHTD